MTTALSKTGASALWILLLTAASVATSLALACATPFPSLAALAAVHMNRRDGIATMLLAWAASQAIGFGLHDYPRDAMTLTQSGALAVGAVAALFAARSLLPRFAAAPGWARLAVAYVAAFAAFKLVMIACALAVGGVHNTVGPAIVANQLVRNAAILIGLAVLHRALLVIGVPAPAGAATA